MFVSTKDQGSPRRRSHFYGVNKGAHSSKLSLLSTFTSTSSGSGGSTSTVTQESFTRTQKEQYSKTRTKKRRPREMKQEKIKTLSKSSASKTEKNEDLDVFRFLVEEAGKEKQALVKEADEDTEDEIAADVETTVEAMKEDLEEVAEETKEVDTSGVHEDSSDPEGYYRGHLSDSGISMGSSSTGETTHFDAVVKAPLPPVMEEPTDRRHSFTHSVADSHYYRADSPMTWYHVHGSGYGREQIPLSPAGSIGNVLPYDYTSKDVPDAAPVHESSSCIKSTPLIFRERNEGPTSPPIFRSFAKVNGQILLQMQANIAELEYELMLLDTKTVSVETSPKHKKSDSTKTRRHILKDQARRDYLYQELHVSLDQYYQSLYATHKVAHITSPSASDETGNFRRWLQTHLLPSSSLPLLLGDGTDLISLHTGSAKTSSLTLRIIAFSILVNIFFPLLVFKFMSSILNRLIFLSVVMAAGALALDKADVKVDLVHRNCIIAFAGISVGAALFC